MAKDVELDRLKATQDLAFQRKQDAYKVQQNAWTRLNSARETMNRAHEAKQQAYEAQESTWQSLSRMRDSYGPRIEHLNRAQETAYQNMSRAFESASSAHESRNGAMAASHAADGHRYKAESQGYVSERRGLVAELRAAKERHENTKPAFQRAKEEFNRSRGEFDQARDAHNRAKQAFQEAKAAFDQASKAFRARLELVKAENARKKNDKREIARRAGVPVHYLDAVWVSPNGQGGYNIYFGGIGAPNGPGHGHYTMDSAGKVTYKREPFDPHGVQNFEENRRESATRQMAQMAMNQWAKTQTTPRVTQHEDSEFKVIVGSGYDRRHDSIVTDVLIFDKQNKREHYHLVIDEHGRELFSEWRLNH